MKVLLVGASGFVGRNVGWALAAAGHQVRPMSRRHGVDLRTMLSPTDWRAALDGIDAVVNAVGIIGQTRTQRFDLLHTKAPVALFRACAQLGVRRVVQISAFGADATAFSPFHLSKRAADDALLGLDVDGCVLRPSLIYGRGGASAALLLRLSAWPVVPVVDAGQQRLQPVHVSDVVATVVRALAGPLPRRTMDVVGPQTLSFAQWLQLLRAAQGRPAAPLLHVPQRLALAMGRWAPAWMPLAAPDNLRMLLAVGLADHRPVERFLGRPLLRPAPELQFEDAAILWRNA